MIKPKQIPDEVVEATAWAMCDDINGEGCWDETPFRHRPMWRSAARAAIAAALDAWPDAFITKYSEGAPAFNLPLTQENSNGSD
jgi:hypothetical protein